MKIIKSLRPNKNDNYTWAEVNCFFRAWGIVFKSYNEVYFNNFIQIMFFYWTFNHENHENADFRNYMLECNDHIFNDTFNLHVSKVNYTSEKVFHELIKAHIDRDNRVMTNGDSINIYYHPGYKTKSNEHFFIISGYDDEKDIYYILDNLHLEQSSSTQYEHFAIPKTTLYESSHIYFSNTETQGQPYIWITESLNGSHKDNTYEVFNKNIYAIDFRFLPDYKNKMMGLFETNEGQSIDKKVENFMMRYHHKVTYFKIIRTSFIGLSINCNHLDALVDKYNSLQKKIVLCLINSTESLSFLEDFIELDERILVEIRNLISSYLTAYKNQVDSISIQDDYRSDLIISNPKGIPVIHQDNQMLIDHSCIEQTDIWMSTDDGFKLLLDKSQIDFQKEILNVELVCEDNESFQAGIIIEYDSYFLMFGPVSVSNISLFNPLNGSAYDMKSIPRLENSVILKAEIDNDCLSLFYKYPHETTFTLFINNLEFNFNKIGLFSRMWEKGQHISKFSNIYFNEKQLLRGAI